MQKPKLSYSKFSEFLGCPLKNTVWSWSSISHSHQRALFSVWADRLVGGRVVMWESKDVEYKARLGGKEKIENLELARVSRYEIYGILCYSKDPSAQTRERVSYDDSALLILRVVDEPEGIVGYVVGETTPEAILKGKGEDEMRPVRYAVSDLNPYPGGRENPDRASRVSSDFRRDRAVRDYVLRAANGVCEYCGAIGFLMANGERYLEAHHIIALANDGADTVDNVIALCPGHHREAHYGEAGERLEHELQEIIGRRGKR